MGLFEDIKRNNAMKRLQEDKLYEMVAVELENNQRNKGLMIKAIAESDGNKNLYEPNYIKLRIQQIKDELEIIKYAQENEVGLKKKNNFEKKNKTPNETDYRFNRDKDYKISNNFFIKYKIKYDSSVEITHIVKNGESVSNYLIGQTFKDFNDFDETMKSKYVIAF